MEKKLGRYSFIIGVILALVLGIASKYMSGAETWLASIMVVLGLVVGFINVADKETKDFLLVSAVLVIVSSVGGASSTLGEVAMLGEYLKGIFTNMLAFVVPATVVVALKDIWAMAQG